MGWATPWVVFFTISSGHPVKGLKVLQKFVQSHLLGQIFISLHQLPKLWEREESNILQITLGSPVVSFGINRGQFYTKPLGA
jgi:hypothetical protein